MQHIKEAIGQDRPPRKIWPGPTASERALQRAKDGYGKEDCPICHGNGYLRRDLPVGHPDFGKIEPCPCRLSAAAPMDERPSGLSEAERQISFADIDLEDSPGAVSTLAALGKLSDESAGIVTIWGEPGNGKTLCVQAACNGLIADGRDVFYVRAPELVECWRRHMGGGRDTDDDKVYDMLERVKHARVLAVDDFDRVHSTAWTDEKVFLLIDERQRLALDGRGSTVIVMNGDPGRLESGIASRLLDWRNVVVHNDDSDVRRALKR